MTILENKTLIEPWQQTLQYFINIVDALVLGYKSVVSILSGGQEG